MNKTADSDGLAGTCFTVGSVEFSRTATSVCLGVEVIVARSAILTRVSIT